MANPAKKINTETNYRTIAVGAAPFIIIGGICIGFGWKYVSRVWKGKPEDKFPRSMFVAALHGGKPALERLIDYRNFQGKATDINVDIKELEAQLGNEQPRFNELQGDFQKALKCKCLQDQDISDARRPLYKAIISLMDQKEQEALDNWTNFKEIQHKTIPPSFHVEEFSEFKNAVNLLKQDIEATQLKKQ
ncbi:hypothetical protein PTKIN_Ptkin18bG0097500 [Pterospermum kingtungense]